MNQNPKQFTLEEPLNFHRAFCELVLEASDADVEEIIRSFGENPEEVRCQAHEAWIQALSQIGENRNDLVSKVQEATPTQRGFSSLMAFLRRGKDMEIPELALSAQVDPKEVSRIESEPGYLPSPRTIVQLERFFELPKDTLCRLSGAVSKESDPLQGELLKFAACSKGMGKLTKDEKRILNEFVKHLVKRSK